MKQKITKGKVIQTCIITAGLAMAGGVGFQFHENQGLTKDLNTLKENHIETVHQLKTASENAKKNKQLNNVLTAKKDKLSKTVQQLEKGKEALETRNSALESQKKALQETNQKLKEQLNQENEFPRRVTQETKERSVQVKKTSYSPSKSSESKKTLTTTKQSSIQTITPKPVSYKQSHRPTNETIQNPSQTASPQNDNNVSKEPEMVSEGTLRTFDGVASAYTLNEPGVTGTTASGKTVRPGMVAMDSSIPLGTKVRITCSEYPSINGVYTVEDRGGAIDGNRVDIYMTSLDHAIDFGKRSIKIEILN